MDHLQETINRRSGSDGSAAVERSGPAAPAPAGAPPAGELPPAEAAPSAARGTEAAVAPAPEAVETDSFRTAIRTPMGWLKWAGPAAAGLLVLTILGWIFLSGDDEEAETQVAVVSPPPPAPPPVVVAAGPDVGGVVIDASPWAEVTEITDAEGYVQELPDSPFTPLHLELPPGSYRIQLQRPGDELDELQLCELEVTAGVLEPCAVHFGEPDVNGYFKASDWWQ